MTTKEGVGKNNLPEWVTPDFTEAYPSVTILLAMDGNDQGLPNSLHTSCPDFLVQTAFELDQLADWMTPVTQYPGRDDTNNWQSLIEGRFRGLYGLNAIQRLSQLTDNMVSAVQVGSDENHDLSNFFPNIPHLADELRGNVAVLEDAIARHQILSEIPRLIQQFDYKWLYHFHDNTAPEYEWLRQIKSAQQRLITDSQVYRLDSEVLSPIAEPYNIVRYLIGAKYIIDRINSFPLNDDNLPHLDVTASPDNLAAVLERLRISPMLPNYQAIVLDYAAEDLSFREQQIPSSHFLASILHDLGIECQEPADYVSDVSSLVSDWLGKTAQII